MPEPDPFEVLDLARTCTPDEVREAWRRAVLDAHPDRGGSSDRVIVVNRARDSILSMLSARSTPTGNGGFDPKVIDEVHDNDRSVAFDSMNASWLRDAPSFSITGLPVDAFGSLRIVADQLGRIIDEEEPYLLEFTLENSATCPDGHSWCRCEVVPEAGASLVHLMLSTSHRVAPGTVESLRDEIVDAINDLDGPGDSMPRPSSVGR